MIFYPNPFTNDFHITIGSNTFDQADVTVFAVTGRIVVKLPAQKVGTSITLGAELTPGTYIVEVKRGGQAKNAKMTKL